MEARSVGESVGELVGSLVSLSLSCGGQYSNHSPSCQQPSVTSPKLKVGEDVVVGEDVDCSDGAEVPSHMG